MPLHVTSAGSSVAKRGNRVVVLREHRVEASVGIMRLSEVILQGASVGVTTPALHMLLANEVPLVLLSSGGRPLGRLEPPSAGHVQTRQAQLLRSMDPGSRLELSRALVAGKIHNQRTLLARRARTLPEPDDTLASLVTRLGQLEGQVETHASVEALLGLEGAASGAYFRGIRRLLPDVPSFTHRQRSGPDVVNAVINYCSALLREAVFNAACAAGLDPQLSFFHLPTRGRPTLAFDLMEEWRPVLLEGTVLSLLRLRTITDRDLDRQEDRAVLSGRARRAIVQRFYDRLASPASTWPGEPGRPSYRDHLARQAWSLRAWVDGSAPAYRAFRWR